MAKQATKHCNHLSSGFYLSPKYAQTTLTSRELRETLLATDGWIMACGSMWDIKAKALGAGIHRVTLEKRNA